MSVGIKLGTYIENWDTSRLAFDNNNHPANPYRPPSPSGAVQRRHANALTTRTSIQLHSAASPLLLLLLHRARMMHMRFHIGMCGARAWQRSCEISSTFFYYYYLTHTRAICIILIHLRTYVCVNMCVYRKEETRSTRHRTLHK